MLVFLQKFFVQLFKFLLFLVVLAIIGKLFFFEVVRTDSYSMVPTLVAGDVFLVFTRGKLGPGNIAVCRNPEDPSSMVVGRILGVPGSTISISQDRVSINGNAADHHFNGKKRYIDNASGEEFTYLVSLADEYVSGFIFTVAFMERAGNKSFGHHDVEDGFFLLNDNRNVARDSRYFGEVPIRDCIGKAIVLVWPAKDNGDFKRKDRFLEWLN